MTRSISPCMSSMYLASSISPLRSRARAVRISAVWGKEPIVVVGNSGRPRRSCCASRRAANGLSRLASESVTCARRSRTCGLRVRGELRRSSSALAFASNSAEIASRPSFSARVSAATSSSFCTANDIQLSTSSSRRGSFVLSTGECCSDDDVETTTLSPACFCSSSSRSRLAARSLIHTLRPLTTPANRVLSSGQPCLATRSRLCGPYTKSSAMPATGSRVSTG